MAEGWDVAGVLSPPRFIGQGYSENDLLHKQAKSPKPRPSPDHLPPAPCRSSTAARRAQR
jgi:hypothetical protein